MSKTDFNKKYIERLEPKATRYNVLDASTRGLGLCVLPSGVKTFYHVRKVQGWPERTTIGLFPETTIEQARGRASELNGKLSEWRLRGYEGINPITHPNGGKVYNLGEVLDHYIENHLQKNAKNPTRAVSDAKRNFNLYLASWRNRPLASIRREDVRERHAQIAAESGGVTANRTVTFLRTLFNHAIHPDIALWEGVNPCAKPSKFLAPEAGRDRVLKDAEAPIFFQAILKEPNKGLRDFVLLAIATGARRGAILAMRWQDIDWQHETWTIPSPKGRKEKSRPHVVNLIKLAVEVLRKRTESGEWVFPGRKKDTHLTTLKKPWKAFITRTGISNLVIHDLRRTLATREGDTGASKEVITKTLGHTRDSAATKIYDRSERREEVREAQNTAISDLLRAGKITRQKLLTTGS